MCLRDSSCTSAAVCARVAPREESEYYLFGELRRHGELSLIHIYLYKDILTKYYTGTEIVKKS